MSAYGGVRGLIEHVLGRKIGKRGTPAPRGPSPRELANRVQQGGSPAPSQTRAAPGSAEATTLGGQTLLGRSG